MTRTHCTWKSEIITLRNLDPSYRSRRKRSKKVMRISPIKHSTEQSEFRQRWQTERSMVESESCYEVIEDLIASQ